MIGTRKHKSCYYVLGRQSEDESTNVFLRTVSIKVFYGSFLPWIIPNTVNREIFVYDNIRVLNVHVNKFLWVPHKNIAPHELFMHVNNNGYI